jgi:predicted extracellular nuclease
MPALKAAGYDIVHFDSPDARGVDVGMLYRKSAFKVIAASSVRLKVSWRDDFKSRDQLVVTGELDGETISVVVNHWPSRRSGPEYREAAAKLSRHIADSLYAINPKAKIFIMGDLNDDPIDPSIAKTLKAIGKQKDLKAGDLFNPMWQLYKDGVGSLGYRDSWNLFDQIIVSEPVVNSTATEWKLLKTRVFNPKFLISNEGQFAGYPFRTFSFGAFIGGYSDHLPVYVVLVKEK